MEAIEYYTYQDYIHWEGKWELMYGQPIPMAPAPMIRHQNLSTLIATELNNSTENCERCMVLIEEDWKIDECMVLKPDVTLICDEPHDAYITKTPEIVIEVVSPSSTKRDEIYKFDIYQKEKAPYYILVYPDALKAKIYKLTEGKYSKEGDFTHEVYTFEETTCKVEIRFENVFKRFRKR